MKYVQPISKERSSKSHNFFMFDTKKWLLTQANSLLRRALELCVTTRAVQRHAIWCVASDFAQKNTRQVNNGSMNFTRQVHSHGD